MNTHINTCTKTYMLAPIHTYTHPSKNIRIRELQRCSSGSNCVLSERRSNSARIIEFRKIIGNPMIRAWWISLAVALERWKLLALLTWLWSVYIRIRISLRQNWDREQRWWAIVLTSYGGNIWWCRKEVSGRRTLAPFQRATTITSRYYHFRPIYL
jgi:hypothetical protein